MKSVFKNILNYLFVALNIPFLTLYFLLRPISRPDDLFSGFSQFYSLFPGQVGIYLRRNFYRFTLEECGLNIVVGFGTLFSHKGVVVGDNVYIGPQCNIGLCEIHSECLVGSGVHILSGKKQHNFNDITKPLKDQGGVYSKVTIGNNCWIGNNAIVMSDIGERSVVGAGVTVTDPVAARKILINENKQILKDIQVKK